MPSKVSCFILKVLIFIMSKGTTGETINTVILLVIAIVALVFLWIVFSGYLKFATFGLEDVVNGFKKWVCNIFPSLIGTFCRIAT